MAEPRVLLVITAYNGEAFIARTLDSALQIDPGDAELDVVVLDDCSPAPGFSGRLAAMCEARGIGYYRSPRNLGIPRNVSLGMLTAVEEGYDHVIISNSDVVYPRNLLSQLLRAVAMDGVGSVTAWSNNVSMYSLQNADPDRHLADQDRVDWLSETLAAHYDDAVMDIPAGISFCMIVPTPVVRDVGVMDPVFGRGYCEETDWSLRSLAAGYRIGLAPGTFVYHAGRGSSLEAGLVTRDHTSVPENEDIIDLRYPLFRGQVGGFAASGILAEAQLYGVDAVMRRAGAESGYTIDAGWLPPSEAGPDLVRCTIAPDGMDGTVSMEHLGFQHVLEDVDAFSVGAALQEFFGGRAPSAVNLRDRGALSTSLQSEFATLSQRHGNYPSRV
ncbi:glycosyltransferase family 2 protein [Nocardioides anomalus]|uniref:Glycosyltransferase family 2 protein n=1 Tax=Nocardioides anomalus TaxID=2712223 RepID=A0A6G6WHJ6_9ACTN|nr:glycosyltransferase family 2 protein [Nocardioides anomalus]QIG44798.1 glycosyltransferase family 2 protein [Nocardioides anomalus]